MQNFICYFNYKQVGLKGFSSFLQQLLLCHINEYKICPVQDGAQLLQWWQYTQIPHLKEPPQTSSVYNERYSEQEQQIPLLL